LFPIHLRTKKTGFLRDGAKQMAGLDELIEDIAERFELGLKEARTVVQEALGLIAAQPRGIDGFLDKLKAAGLEEKEASWLGEPYPMALSVREVKKALSAEEIERIAKNAGITESIACHVLGYAIPKTIVLLTHHGAHSEAFSFLSFPGGARHPLSRVEEFNLRSEGQVMQHVEGGGYAAGLRLVVPGAALLMTLGVFGYAIASGTARDGASIQFPLGVAGNAPLTFPWTPSMPSQLAPGIELGLVTYSGTTSGLLNSVLGTGNIPPDLALEAARIQNPGVAFDAFASQDARTLFAGNEFNGTPSDAARAWMMGSLQFAHVPEFGMTATTVSSMANIRMANIRIALSTSPSGSSGNESGKSLNQEAVDFPTLIFLANSAKVPSRSIAVLRDIAGRIKQLPPGTMVQLNGYAHGTRASASGVELSQRRADSVAEILIREGVSPAMLSAKGYGSPSLAAFTGGTMEGRSSTMKERSQGNDRRVELRVVSQHP
jgi:outer membrane protein OmpA-like peptidoglycan-associated protein/uncharacterized protein YidB (DUF937 family)